MHKPAYIQHKVLPLCTGINQLTTVVHIEILITLSKSILQRVRRGSVLIRT